MKGRKAQSAMEYLMTYGWAILIIAIVLAALFSLGVFSSSSLLGTTCISLSGYVCTNPVLHNGIFTATLGQATGTSWSSANIIFVESGAGVPTATSFTAGCADATSNGIPSGGTVSFTTGNGMTGSGAAACTALPNSVGSTVSGAIWADYSAAGGVSGLITQLATVTLKGS